MHKHFPITFLPSHFRCIPGVDFTYHHHIYHTFSNQITFIIPLLQLVVSSFELKYIFPFCRRDLLTPPCPFDFVTQFIQEECSSQDLSIHICISNKFGDSISCCRLCSSSWLSPIFNTFLFSLITTKNLDSLLVSSSN